MACANCVHAELRLCAASDLIRNLYEHTMKEVEGYSYIAFCQQKGHFVVNNAACSRFLPMFVVEPRLEPEVLDAMEK
jgi:hypothetical protein